MRASLRPETGLTARAGGFRRFSAFAAVLVALAVILASCDSGDSSSESKKDDDKSTSATTTTEGAQQASTEPIGAEATIAEYLKGQGIEYVGDCADAELPEDKGKWCSTLVSGGEDSDTATYELGPVGEKPEKTINLKRHGATQLTPGFQVGVGDGNVGTPTELTREQLEADTWITGNLVLDQAAGIGNGLADLPAGADTDDGGGGGGGGGGTTTPTTTPPQPGNAQYPPNGEIVVTPTVEVGGEAVFRGSGCLANEPLTVYFDGQPVGTVTADASGSFAGSITIPKGTAPGTHLLTVRGSACVFNTSINVAGALAFTGSSSNTGTYVLVGVAAVVAGLVLVVGSRRRHKGVGHRKPPPAAA